MPSPHPPYYSYYVTPQSELRARKAATLHLDRAGLEGLGAQFPGGGPVTPRKKSPLSTRATLT